MLCMEVYPYSCFRWCRYFWGPWVSFAATDKFTVGFSCELIAYLSVFDLFLTQQIMAISKRCKPDNFELLNSLKFSFKNIQDLHSSFVACESFLEYQALLTLLFYWDKLVWLNWFVISLWGAISSFHPKGFCYSYA